MTSKLAHGVVTFSLPKGEKNVTTSQNIEVCDAKGIPHLYRPQRSCGKVMFSQVSVILFTGGVYAQHALRQTPPSPGRHPQADTPWEDTPPGRHSPPRTDTFPGQTPPPGKHPPPDGHCSGRYASYWNAL